MTKLKGMTIVLLAAILLGGGGRLLTYDVPGAEPMEANPGG